jgi:hypothetical protein
MAQNLLLYRVRVAVEASAVLLRCIATYIFVTKLGVRKQKSSGAYAPKANVTPILYYSSGCYHLDMRS